MYDYVKSHLEKFENESKMFQFLEELGEMDSMISNCNLLSLLI